MNLGPLRRSKTSSPEDNWMFPSHKHLSARPVTRLGSALAITVFTVLTVTEAAGTPIQSTSTASMPAPFASELRALILRDCRDIDYGRVDGFEGMLSDFVCGS